MFSDFVSLIRKTMSQRRNACNNCNMERSSLGCDRGEALQRQMSPRVTPAN